MCFETTFSTSIVANLILLKFGQMLGLSYLRFYLAKSLATVASWRRGKFWVGGKLSKNFLV